MNRLTVATQYYDIWNDVHFPGRWFLGGLFDSVGREIDERVYTEGRVVGKVLPRWEGDPVTIVAPLRFELQTPGTPLDFTFNGFGVPVVTEKLGAALAKVAPDEVQRVPVAVSGSGEQYEILNVTSRLKCLNEDKSVYGWWTEADGEPERVGQYRGVNPIIIYPEKAAGHHLFRLAGWEIALIVSEQVKALLESMEVTGVKFKCVTEE